MLYALRYEKESPVQLMHLCNKLASRSAKYKSGLVQFLVKQGGVDKRTGDISRPQDVVVFVVGGTTYEEARAVALQNASNSGTGFILGDLGVLNSKRFLKDLEETQRIPSQTLVSLNLFQAKCWVIAAASSWFQT
ncbi:hypothetical protein MKW98_019351 [Papaver atlanticum]|uniref:Uncharacterized protein n=1 Tax=Papaver atlanticum TaxID=357466 RepID=A0AAD4XAZ5_9MAGN|nr:hypothetical protein MKW98_019351 [Papaver atlanticum]